MTFDLHKKQVSALIRFHLELIEDSPQKSNRMPPFVVLGIDKVFSNILCSIPKRPVHARRKRKILLQISDNPLKGNTKYW
jgi:hypothetical protein